MTKLHLKHITFEIQGGSWLSEEEINLHMRYLKSMGGSFTHKLNISLKSEDKNHDIKDVFAGIIKTSPVRIRLGETVYVVALGPIVPPFSLPLTTKEGETVIVSEAENCYITLYLTDIVEPSSQKYGYYPDYSGEIK